MRRFKIDYLVPAHGVIERGTFYNYMISKGYKSYYTRDETMERVYPYVISTKNKRFGLANSTIACMHLQQAGKLRTIEEFKEIVESKKK